MGNNLKKYYVFDQVLHTQVKDSTIIIDGSIWLHQALSSYRTVSGDLFMSKNGVITSHIYGLLHKMVPLITRGNRLIFCIDGSKLPEKEENTKNRRVQRQNHKRVLQNLKNCLNITREQIYIASKRVIQVTPDLFTTVEYFLGYLGIPYIRSENEAESQCAHIQQTLTAKGIKSYVYTPDSDALIFGADNIIMAQNRGVYQIASLDKTLQSIQLSLVQLVDIVLQNLKNCLNITREQIYIASKRVIQVTPDLFTTVEYFLGYLGIPYIRSENEAESQCAHIQQTLTAKGIKSYVYTPDSDALIFGADNIIMAQNRGVYQIASLDKTLQSIQLSLVQLVDIVLLSGGDYTSGVRGVGCITAMKLIRKYGSLTEIPASSFGTEGQQSFKSLLNNYNHLQGLYNNAPINQDYNIGWKEPDLQSLESFLVDELNFSRHQLIPLANYYIRLGI